MIRYQMAFPENVYRALLHITSTIRVDSLIKDPEKAQGFSPKLKAGDPLYQIESNELLWSRLGVTEARMIKDVREALLHCKVPIIKEDLTKGRYRSYYFVLNTCVLSIGTLRRGGKGLTCMNHEAYQEQIKQADARDNKQSTREKALAKVYKILNQDELIALGLPLPSGEHVVDRGDGSKVRVTIPKD